MKKLYLVLGLVILLLILLLGGYFLAPYVFGSQPPPIMFVWLRSDDILELYRVKHNSSISLGHEYLVTSRIWPSATGKRIAIWQETGVLEIRSLDGDLIATLENVGQSVYEQFPVSENMAWSPNEDKLAFLRDSPDGQGINIFIYDLTAQQAIQLTNDNRIKHALSWAVDGSQLAFSTQLNCEECSADKLFWDIQVVRSNGSEQKTVLDMRASGLHNVLSEQLQMLCNLKWSPDGSYIAFHDNCYMYGGPVSWQKDAFIARTDGSGVVQVTEFRQSGFSVNEIDFHWLEDSNSLNLAYVGRHGDWMTTNLSTLGIIRVQLDEQVTSTEQLISETEASLSLVDWSPNGKYLAWKEGLLPTRLVVAKISDDDVSVLTASSGFPASVCTQPVWSPDSDYLVYAIPSQESESLECVYKSENSIMVVSIPSGKVIGIANDLDGDKRPVGWVE